MQYIQNLEMVREILKFNQESKEPIIDFIMALAAKRNKLNVSKLIFFNLNVNVIVIEKVNE